MQPDALAVRHDAHLVETIEGAANSGAQSGDSLRDEIFMRNCCSTINVRNQVDLLLNEAL